MRKFLLLLFVFPLLAKSQNGNEVEFDVKKKDEKIYLIPNFDTSILGSHLLITPGKYSFTLMGIDSAGISKVMLNESACKTRKVDGNATLIEISAEFYVRDKGSWADCYPALRIYRKGDNGEDELCFVERFTIRPVYIDHVRARGPKKIITMKDGRRRLVNGVEKKPSK